MMRWLRHLLYLLTLAAFRLTPRRKRRGYRLTILKLDRLGDAVLSLGAVRLLIKEFGDQATLLIVSPVAEPLFRREFPTVELLVIPPFCARFWPDFVLTMVRHAAVLRAISTDRLVCLRHQPSDYLHAIARMTEAKSVHACKWVKPWERVCLTFPRCRPIPYPERATDDCLELAAHRLVVASVLGRPVGLDEVRPFLAADSLDTNGSLLVCPAAGSEIRQYPPPQLAAAIGLFLQSVPSISVRFCLPPEMSRQPWEQALREAGIVRVTWHHPEGVNELIQAMGEARLVLAPDSASAHLATALNKPGVFLLGGGHFGMFAPWRRSPQQVWLNHQLDCYQCRWNCIQSEPFCITHIQPVTIADALLGVYQASTQSC